MNDKLDGVIWLKCKSTKRNMFYYYNTITHQSVWEEPEGDHIIDHSEDDLQSHETQNPTINSTSLVENEKRQKLNNIVKKNQDYFEVHPKRNDLLRLQKDIKKHDNKETRQTDSNLFSTQPNKLITNKSNIITKPIPARFKKGICNKTDLINNTDKKIFRTPIYDRFYKKPEEMLRKPNTTNQNSPNNRSSKKIFRTPIQDRYYKKPEEMLRKPNTTNQNSPNNRSSKKIFRTPIQDRYYKKSEEMLRKPNTTNSVIPIPTVGPANNLQVQSEFSDLNSKHEITTEPNSKPHIIADSLNEALLNTLHKSPIASSPRFPGSESLAMSKDPTNLKPKNELPSEPNCTSRITDARHILNKRKRLSSTSISSDCAMEWEPITETITIYSDDDRKRRKIITVPPAKMSSTLPIYRHIFLVCDTNVLLDEFDAIEKIVDRGFHGFLVTIVIPTIVFKELNNIKKNESKTKVGFISRKVSRFILNSLGKQNFLLQDGPESNKPTNSLVIETNDDSVLNCGLQFMNKCKEGEMVFLMTSDNLLEAKAAAFKLKSFTFATFRKWARSMDFDGGCHINGKQNTASPTIASNKQGHTVNYSHIDMDECERMEVDSESRHTDQSLHFENCTLSCTSELKVHFQDYLDEVLSDKLNELYGDLPGYKENQYGKRTKPSSTIFDYLTDINKRWELITTKRMRDTDQSMFRSIISLIKKSTSSKETFNGCDFKKLVDLCKEFANTISPTCTSPSRSFLQKVDILLEEWNNEHDAENQPISPLNNEIEGHLIMNKTHIALETIYNNLNHDFSTFVEAKRKGEFFSDPNNILHSAALGETVNNISYELKCILKENTNRLTHDSPLVSKLVKTISKVSNGAGEPYIFKDINTSGIIELLKDKACRKFVEALLENLNKLNSGLQEFIKNIRADQDSPNLNSDIDD